MIVGLDNQLNCMDLERGEGKLGRHYFSFHMQEDKKEEDEIAKAAGGDKDFKALLEKYSKLFAGDEKYFPLSKLPPWEKYNLLLYRLRRKCDLSFSSPA